MTIIEDARRSSTVRRGGQVVVIAALIIAAFVGGTTLGDLRDDKAEEQAKTTQIEGTLALTCTAANFDTLQQYGLLSECDLAMQGELADSIPDGDLPEPGEDPTDVEPDVVDDDDEATPSVTVVEAQVDAAVARYFVENPLPTDADYAAAIKVTVGRYLRANPPEPGRPPTPGEIRTAVRDALLANPPEDGTDGEPGEPGTSGTPGEPGRGVATATLDGCDVVFTYSDGTSDRIGPLCGPEGPIGPTGPAGEPGPTGVVDAIDNCDPPEDHHVVDTDLTYDPDLRAVVLTCDTEPDGLLGP